MVLSDLLLYWMQTVLYIFKESNRFCQIWPHRCLNSAGLLSKIHGVVRFAPVLDANSAVLLNKAIGFVRFGHIGVQIVLDY